MARLICWPFVAVLIALVLTPDAGARTWRIEPVPGTQGAYLSAAAGFPAGGRVLLITRRVGRERRLELVLHGRRRLLARSLHSFDFAKLAVGGGGVTVLWETIPAGSGDRDAYVYEHGRVHRLTSGARSASWAALAIARDGSGVVAVQEGPQVLVARRAIGGSFGPMRPSVLTSLDGAAVGGHGTAALVGGVAGQTIADRAPVVLRATGADAQWSAPAALPPVDPGAGRTPMRRQASVAMTFRGRIVVGYSTLIQRDIPPSEAEPPIVDTVVRAAVWDPADPAPRMLPDLASGHIASDVRVLAAGDRVWSGWTEEPSTSAPGAIAVASVDGGSPAIVRRIPGPAGVSLGSGFDAPVLSRAGGDGVRFTATSQQGRSVLIRTTSLTAGGRFGPLDVVASGSRFGYPVAFDGARDAVLGLTVQSGRRPAAWHVVLARP